MSDLQRYYLSELLMEHNKPKCQGRELLFADEVDAELAALRKVIAEQRELLVGIAESHWPESDRWLTRIRKHLEATKDV